MYKITKRGLIGGLAAATAFATSMVPASAQSTLERIKAERKITIGVANTRPWGYRDENGDVAGFSPDLIRAALEPLGVQKIEFVVSEFPALISSLTSGRFDVIAAGMWITPIRCKAIAFSNPDLITKDAVLVKKGNPFNIHSYQDIAKNPRVKVGADRGSAAVEHAASAGVPKDRLVLFSAFDGAIAALTSDRVEAVPLSSANVGPFLNDPNLSSKIERALPFSGYIGKSGIEVAGRSAIGFRLGDTELRDYYNKRLAEMKSDGTFAEIKKKYGIQSDTEMSVTAERACSED